MDGSREYVEQLFLYLLRWKLDFYSSTCNVVYLTLMVILIVYFFFILSENLNLILKTAVTVEWYDQVKAMIDLISHTSAFLCETYS